jgi:cytochrome oxidase assembly protein ShyY1
MIASVGYDVYSGTTLFYTILWFGLTAGVMFGLMWLAWRTARRRRRPRR